MQQVRVDRTREAAGGSWWRWPLLPFAAVSISLLAAAVLVVCQHVVLGPLFGYDNVYLVYSVPLQASMMAGFAFSWSACAIAPSGKRIAGTVLVTLLGVFVVFGLAAACTGRTEAPVASAIQYVACLASAVAGLATYRDERLARLLAGLNRLLESGQAARAMVERE
ncbi:MAG TPA: hypothetical protein VMU47_20290 [Caldimonas sp.]|nr:hypothetical protein [Caldimonas sp.]